MISFYALEINTCILQQMLLKQLLFTSLTNERDHSKKSDVWWSYAIRGAKFKHK